MRKYVIVSTVFFDLLLVVQLLRLFMRWPVYVAGVAIPLWVSGIAVVILASFAIAGTRALLRSRPPASGVL